MGVLTAAQREYRESVRPSIVSRLRDGWGPTEVSRTYSVPLGYVQKLNQSEARDADEWARWTKKIEERCERERQACTSLLLHGVQPFDIARMVGVTLSSVLWLADEAGVQVSGDDGMGYIYALMCPLRDKCFYVGQSENPIRRRRQHELTPSPYMKADIDAIQQRDQRPMLNIIERVEQHMMNDREVFWIRAYKLAGHPLVNVFHTKEARA